MVLYRVRSAPARGEFLVEAVIPSQGNATALIAVFASEAAADVYADIQNSLVEKLEISRA